MFWCSCYSSFHRGSTVQMQREVTDYFLGKQLLLFALGECVVQFGWLVYIMSRSTDRHIFSPT